MRPSAACSALVKKSEALRLFAYPDPASALAAATPDMARRWGRQSAASIIEVLDARRAILSGSPWTIGYGHTSGVTRVDEVSEHQADVLLGYDLTSAAETVSLLVTVPLSQGQFDALTDFVLNLGALKFAGSTLLRLLNAGDYAGAREQLYRWVYAGGKVMAGLQTRCAARALLWDAPDAATAVSKNPDFSNVQSGIESTATEVIP